MSSFGEKVIHEMNRLGIMVDLSHGGEKSFYDALDISQTPIVCSHSSSRALCDVPRNLTDDQMRALAAKGGVAHTTLYHGFLRKEGEADIMDAIAHLEHAIDVMGIDHVGLGLAAKGGVAHTTLYHGFLRKEGEADIMDAIAHLEHAIDVMGIDHVGLGTDFDGDGGIRGLADSSELINFTLQLLRRKYSEQDIVKIWGGNWLRVIAIAHLEHAIDVMGIDHVGLGTDFDGDGGIRGLADSSELINFTLQLLRRKYSEQDIVKIWGGNWLRVMTQVQNFKH